MFNGCDEQHFPNSWHQPFSQLGGQSCGYPKHFSRQPLKPWEHQRPLLQTVMAAFVAALQFPFSSDLPPQRRKSPSLTSPSEIIVVRRTQEVLQLVLQRV